MSSSEVFESGAVRSGDAADVRYDLISPIGLRRVAKTCKEGEEKYSAFNWEKGMPIWSLLNHAIRHIFAYLAGDRTEDHLGHAAWGLLAACHSEEKWPHMNRGTLRTGDCDPPDDPDDESPLGSNEFIIPKSMIRRVEYLEEDALKARTTCHGRIAENDRQRREKWREVNVENAPNRFESAIRQG